jgi:hypothetical protein
VQVPFVADLDLDHALDPSKPGERELGDLVRGLADPERELADPGRELAYPVRELADPARKLADRARALDRLWRVPTLALGFAA